MYVSKRVLMLIVVAAMALGSVASVAAQDSGDTRERGTAQRAERAGGPQGLKLGAAMRSEAVFAGRDGGAPVTVRMDRGVVDGVQDGAVRITQEDGRTVTVPVSQDTMVRRDGADATLADLQAGDQVHTVRAREGDGEFVTRAVRAFSPERVAQMQERVAQMQERREQMQERREQMRERRGQMRERIAEHRANGGMRARTGGAI